MAMKNLKAPILAATRPCLPFAALALAIGAGWAAVASPAFAAPEVQGFTIEDTLNAEPSGWNYFIERNSANEWQIASDPDSTRQTGELLIIDWAKRRIWLGAPVYNNKGVRERDIYTRASCTKGLLGHKSRAEGKYGVCNSAFTKMASETGLGTLISAPITALVVGSVVYGVVIDADAVAGAVAESHLLDKVAADAEARKLAAYRGAYANATRESAPSTQLVHFIDTYTRDAYDPDNLLVEAKRIADERQGKEAAVARALDEERKIEGERLARLEEERRKDALAKTDAEAHAAAARAEASAREAAKELQRRLDETRRFRAALKVETETNCGPIVEMRGNLMKVYSPVSNYGNEHWIPRNNIFPPGYGCRFFNGAYQAPYPY